MALHGQLKVNGAIIGFWSARRLNVERRDINLYRCELDLLEAAEPQHFTIEHRYTDGAAVLAAKVLSWKPYPHNHPLAQEKP